VLALLLAACSGAVEPGGTAGGMSTAGGSTSTAGGMNTAGGMSAAGGMSTAGGTAGGQATAGGATAGGSMTSTSCAPLPAATGTTVRVTPSQAAMLPGIVSSAAAGTTILLADGTYAVPGTGINLSKAGQTLRSESGNPSAVILDGQYTTNEVLRVTASDVTVAELTVTRAVDHPVHVYPPTANGNIRGMRFYRVRFIDGGEQFLKSNSSSTSAYTDEGTVECSHFELTDLGRPHVERAVGGCYTGGIDVHGGRGWVVRKNTFKDIFCAGEGLAEHAVHFWTGSRDTLVEQNVITNCARGVGFGLGNATAGRVYVPDPYPGVTNVGHYGGIIRNNFIWANNDWFDTGIGLEQSRGTMVLHNTVVSTAGTSFFSSIDVRFDKTVATVRNNLARRITQRDAPAMVTADHNLEMAATSLFVSFATADLHLVPSASAAINAGIADAQAGLDIDGLAHDVGLPDLGAHEKR